MKTGLVLEGGAMRGMFTAGVLDVLMEHGIVLDGAIGVSAGAVVSAAAAVVASVGSSVGSSVVTTGLFA